jgi:hypothetical protein
MLLGNNRKGPEVSYNVRYQGGRKQFAKLEGKDPTQHARAFANEQRAKEGGWAQIERVTTEIIERRR